MNKKQIIKPLIKENPFIEQLQIAIQICEWNDELTVLHANSAFYHLWGHSGSNDHSLSNSLLLLASTDEEQHKIKAEIIRQLQTKQAYAIEYPITCNDQEVRWILEEGNGITYQGESFVCRVYCDITKQKQLEEDLQLSERRYEIALDRSDVTLFDYDIITKQMIFCDDDMRNFGFPRMIDNSIEFLVKQQLIHPSSVQNYIDLYQRVSDGAEFASAQISIYVGEGEVRVFEISLSTLFDKRGKAIRAIGVKKDVTDVLLLQREKEYNQILTAEHSFFYEVNISKDRMISSNLHDSDSLHIENILSFKSFIQAYIDQTVYPPHQAKVLDAFSHQNVMSHLENGENRYFVTYLCKDDSGKYHWVKNTVNVVLDLVSKDVMIRCYISEAHDQKEEDSKNGAQAKHYQALLAKSFAYYEINVTRSEFLSGYEYWAENYKIELKNYELMLKEFVDHIVYHEDQINFLKTFSKVGLLESFYQGDNKIVHEYRERNRQGIFQWVRYTVHLYEDTYDGDIFADGYVEIIHEEKEKELDLIYKSQHDSLTGYLNKATLEERVKGFLATPEAKQRKHAFIIIDLDSFKAINDNFGHAFGDAVISRASAKIAGLFRDIDILGRIGGDEFVVFMKNIRHESIVLSKATEIFETIFESFTQNGIDINISASIGIAYYHDHGLTYQELYEHSDTALYHSKEHGRNCYTVYSPEMCDSDTNIKKIDQSSLMEVKKFDDNIIEYIFRILYESKDKRTAINAVLALVGKHYNVSRTYVFEDRYATHTSNTFEWCNQGVEAQMNNLQFIAYKDIGDYARNFNGDGIFYIPDIDLQPTPFQTILNPQGVRSMLQYSIVKNGIFAGFIGFDQCGFIRIPSPKEISDLKNIANILGVFIMEMRTMEENELSRNLAMSIVNGLDSYAYVCDPENYRILFINDQTLMIQPTASVGQFCYKAFWNREEVCPNCPMVALKASDQSRFTIEMENTNLQVWVKATASWIDWMNSRKACLVDSVDITEYKRLMKGEGNG